MENANYPSGSQFILHGPLFSKWMRHFVKEQQSHFQYLSHGPSHSLCSTIYFCVVLSLHMDWRFLWCRIYTSFIPGSLCCAHQGLNKQREGMVKEQKPTTYLPMWDTVVPGTLTSASASLHISILSSLIGWRSLCSWKTVRENSSSSFPEITRLTSRGQQRTSNDRLY